MDLILAVIGAGPIGFYTSTRRKGFLVYLAAWTVVFQVQTIVLFIIDDGANNAVYWVVSAVILCLGIGLNRLGSVLRERRRGGSGTAEVVA
jgi:uncharacterized protein YqgC (DUF456 family)